MTGLWSIGHSNLEADAFAALLERHGIERIVDVRSVPRSRFTRWADGANLGHFLSERGVEARFMGDVLGGRPVDPASYRAGIAHYPSMAKAEGYARGLSTLLALASQARTAMLCSEGNPLECHRCLLLGRSLYLEVDVAHVLRDGSVMTQSAAIDAMLADVRSPGLFPPDDAEIDAAYAKRSARFAYRTKSNDSG